MKTFLISLVLLLPGLFLHGQDYSGYTLESLVDLMGRSEYSPKLSALLTQVHFTKSMAGNDKIWYNEELMLRFTGDDLFSENLHTVQAIGFMLEEAKTRDVPILKKGFEGILPNMKRSKADKILKAIDPDYVNDGKNKAWANYKDDYRIKVQFNGEKSSSQVLRVYVYPEEDIAQQLKQDFAEYGPEVLVRPSVINRWNVKKRDHIYINVIPPKDCENCLQDNQYSGTIHFPDGSEFTGSFLGMLGQEGIYTFTDTGKTWIFTGTFFFGEASGPGQIIFPDGNIVKGNWKIGQVIDVQNMVKDGYVYSGKVNADFQMHGRGTVKSGSFTCEGKFSDGLVRPKENYTIKQDGNVYIGRINGSFQPNGQGRLTMANNDTYDGSFINGDFNGGNVSVSFDDGSKYKGEYNSDIQMHGRGTYTLADGQIIIGQFTNGQFSGGTGILTMGDGSTYTGEVNGQMKPEGKGKYTYPNGNYINCISGNGVFTHVEGRKKLDDVTTYTGQLNSKMLPDGKGRVDADNGSYIEGNFSNNVFLGGKGFIKYNDGQTYKGEIDGENQPNGKGIYSNIPGKDYIEATFRNNSVVPGPGIRQFGDGSRFKGKLDSQGNPDGYGTLYVRAGMTITGTFKGNRAIGSVTIEDNGQTWEGPVDAQLRPNGKGRFKTSGYGTWQTGTFSHGQRQ